MANELHSPTEQLSYQYHLYKKKHKLWIFFNI